MIPTMKIRSFGLLLALVGVLVVACGGGAVLAQEGTTQTTTGSASPAAAEGATGTIVYRGQDSSGIAQLFTIPAGGGTPTQLTTGTNSFLDQPSFSPDGTKIAYVATVDSLSHFEQIFTIPSTGGTPTQVTDSTVGLVSSPTFSPDGTKIAYGGTDPVSHLPAILIVPSSGGTPTVSPIGITPNGPLLNFGDPVFSPDGTKIALEAEDGSSANGSYQIFTIPSSGGTPTRVTNDAATNGNFGPHFSRDGTKIAFAAEDPGEQIHVISSDAIDGTSSQLTNDTNLNRNPTFSPDGTLIAYEAHIANSSGGFNSQIFTIPSGGGTPTQLTTDETNHDNPDWGDPPTNTNPPPPPTGGHHKKHHGHHHKGHGHRH